MSLTDFQMSVLQLMYWHQSQEIIEKTDPEVLSFGTGFFRNALGLNRFAHNHHQQMNFLVDKGWVYVWKEKNGRKYFALKNAAYIFLGDKMTHAKSDMWRTGLNWYGWDGGKNAAPWFGVTSQEPIADEPLKRGKPSS